MKPRLLAPLLAALVALFALPSISQAGHDRRYAGNCHHCETPLYAYLQIAHYGARGPVFHWVTDYHGSCRAPYRYGKKSKYSKKSRYYKPRKSYKKLKKKYKKQMKKRGKKRFR